MTVEILASGFDPHRRLGEYRRGLGDPGACGAEASFTGYMRDHNEGEPVQALTLEHYPGMTERHLQAIEQEARQRWDIRDVLIVHRVGEIAVGEAIVLVGVWSAHRAAAFEACRFIMEDLKSRAPFWKKEQLEQGERWVEKNTPGYTEARPVKKD